MSGPHGTRRAWGRAAEVAAAVASVAVFGVALAAVRPGHAAAAGVLLVAMAWAMAPVVIDALVPRRASAPPAPSGPVRGWTTVVCLGAEADDVAAASIRMAAAAGPTVVATARPIVDPAIVPPGVGVVRGASVTDAVVAAAEGITTEVVLLLSAGAFPIASGCRGAAAAMTDDVGWVVARAHTFNRDGYAPDGRGPLSARLRDRARRAGAALWERDATLVRTELLRGTPIGAHRPWGTWLRQAQARGHRGVSSLEAVAWRTVSPAAASFWPATVTRQRAAVADAAAAARTGGFRARALCVALVLRELYAYPLAVLLLSPLLIASTSGVPFTAPLRLPLLAALLASAAIARWAGVRMAHGEPLRPAADLAAATVDLPGSLLALPALSGRNRPTRVHLTDRPLVWMALVLTVVSSLPLLGAASASGRGARTAAALALVDLAALWLFAVGALVRRAWARQTWRVPLRLPVVVDGVDARAVDASPTGIAIAGDLASVAVGHTVQLSACLADGEPWTVTGHVVGRRRRGEEDVLGCSLALDDSELARWTSHLATAAGPGDRPAALVPAAAAPPTARLGRWAERAVAVVLAGLSVPAVAALGLVLLGYRPLVVRSESMVPTLRVGDVAVVEWVPARSIHPGDVVTYPRADGTDTVTHRVRAVSEAGPVLAFETRGDANEWSEQWSRPRDALLGRVVWHVPRVGAPVAELARHRSLLEGALGVGALLGAGALVISRRSRPTVVVPG